MSAERTAPIRVLQGEKWPDARANPYIPLLYSSLESTGVAVLPFSWSRALLGKYDIVHLHWPEFLVSKSSRLKTWVARALLILFLLRLELLRTPLVLTKHNASPHESLDAFGQLLLGRIQRAVAYEVHLTPPRSEAARVPASVIPHGDYREWYAAFDKPDPVAGRMLFFGQVREYKRLNELIQAFMGAQQIEAILRIVGAGDAELIQQLRTQAAPDHRIEIVAGHTSDEDLCREISEAELVVLPYEILNSGALLLALSLDRPVLTLTSTTVSAMQDEVGERWILDVEGAIDPGAIARGVAFTRERHRGVPDLGRRNWADAGRAYRDIYAKVLADNKGVRA